MNQENMALGVKDYRFSGPGGPRGHTPVEYVYWSTLPTCGGGKMGSFSWLADPAGLELGSCILPREQ